MQTHTPNTASRRTLLSDRKFLTSTQVMKALVYTDRPSFLAWIKHAGVPHIRLNARKFIFDEQQLSDWLAAHGNHEVRS